MKEDPIGALRPVSAPPTLVADVLGAVGLTPDRFVVRPSAIGDVLVAYNDRGISACLVVAGRTVDEVSAEFQTRFGRACLFDEAPDPGFVEALDRVLAGASAAELTFDLRSASAFQRSVLEKAAQIPAGEVRPYGWIAAQIGRPGAVRAVGTALGRNPVPLLIPCHRVVRTDGRIGDYAFGSLAKRLVLTAEGVDVDQLQRQH
jgi:O-6-methylguanine DNA methyltransferase